MRWGGRAHLGMKAGTRHPMAGAEHAKHGRVGARPTSRCAPARLLRAPGPFGRHAPGAARVLRAPGPFGRPAPRAVLSRFRALRVDRPVDSDFAEAESCGERPGRFPGDPRMFFAPCRWGSGGNRDRLPPSKERDKSVLTVREGNYTARASFQYNTGRFGLERLACSEFPAEARFTSPNQNCYNTDAR